MKSQELFERVSSQLAAQIAAGASGEDWSMPWRSFATGRPRSIDGRPYRGFNTMVLTGEQMDAGYSHPIWGTYEAWKKAGAQVRKMEPGDRRGTPITLWKPITAKDQPEDTDEARAHPGTGRGMFCKVFTVFNCAQVDGYEPPPLPVLTPVEVDERAEAFLAATGAAVRHGGSQAFYRPSSDSIQLPERDAFHDGPAYYATSAHEHVHWSGHESRLARTFGKRFGDDAYAVEELTAEIGAAMICAELDIEPAVRLDHAAYVEHWLRVLRTDATAIRMVASAAQKAFDFLAAFSTPAEVAQEVDAA